MRDGGSPDADAQWWMRLERSPRGALAVVAVLLTALIGPLWYATPDAAAYLSIARRLSQGAPPHAFGQPQPSFPLGYPLLISPAFHIAPDPFVLLSVVNWLLAIAFMLATYQWMRRVVPDAAVLLTLLVMANINVWNLYRRTLSEVLFLPLLMWTVALAGGALTDEKGSRRATRVAAVTILLVWLTATRETGILAALAVAAATFTSRRSAAARGPLIAAGATAAAVGAFVLLRPERRAAAINAMVAAFGDGHDAGGNALSVVLLGLQRRIVEVAQLTVPGMFKAYTDPPAWWDVNLAVGVAAVGFVVVGWYRLVHRRADALVLMGPLYFVALTLWPYESARYLLPLLPLFVACKWEAWAVLGNLRRWLITLTLLAHCAVAAGYWWSVDRPRAQACTAAWPAVQHLADTVLSDAHAVAARALPACETLMLGLALDRPVRAVADSDPLEDAVGWVVSRDDRGAEGGFVRHSAHERYILWQRLVAPDA